MKQAVNRCRGAAIVVLVLLCLSGCTQAPPVPLRVGTNVWPGYEPLYLARHLGYFETIPIRLVEYTSASEVMRAFRNGMIEAGALTFDEVLVLAQDGLDVRVVLVMDVSHGADVLLARPGVKGIADLKGKVVGAENTATGAYMLTRALQRAGLPLREVRLVPLLVIEHERAFLEGKVDAVVTFEPYRTRLMNQGARKLFDSSQIPDEIVDVLVVRGEVLDRRPQLVRQLLRAWFRALDELKENPAEAALPLAEREGLSDKQFLNALQRIRLPDHAENLRLLRGQPAPMGRMGRILARLMREQKLLTRDVDAEALLDSRFLDRLPP